jgi:hypothetical protein
MDRARAGAALALALAVLTAGCSERPAGTLNPNYREPFVNGYVYRAHYRGGDIEHDKDISVNDNAGLRMVPIVTLNGRSIEPYYYSITSYRYGDDSVNLTQLRSELRVTHYWGEAFAHATMPGDFRLVAPADGSVFDPESTLLLAWTRSEAAQWYWVSFVAEYDYLDQSGQWDDYEFRLDTLVLDRSLLLPPGRIFPDFVQLVTEGDASLLVWSGNGPAVEPGDVGNVRGVGGGFFSAINEPAELYFYVGAPPRERLVPAPAVRAAAFRSRLSSRQAPE